MKIVLGNGYFVEVEGRDFTLKQNYQYKTKEGVEKEGVKSLGYFANLNGAIERYLILNQSDLNTDSSVEMKEYLELVRVANENAIKAFEAIMECGRE